MNIGITASWSSPPPTGNGWEFSSNGRKYNRREIEAMSDDQLNSLYHDYHAQCLEYSMYGEHMFIETTLRCMVLERRVAKIMAATASGALP